MYMKRIWALALAVLLLLGCGRAETFLVTSDLHLTRDVASPALDALRAQTGDIMILLGDSTNNAHDEEHARVLAFLESAGRRAYVIPGNHDLTDRFGPSDYAGLYADYGWNAAFSRDADTASYAVMTPGGTCLVMLDTNAFDASGHVIPTGGVREATAAWVAETLSALPEGTPAVACGHHPLLPDRLDGALAEALRAGGVRLYLCGHDHGFAAVRVDGLQQVTVGQPHAYPGWAGLLEVTPAGYHWRVLPLYDEDDPLWQAMRDGSHEMGRNLADSTLKDTPYEGDAAAIDWFAEAFDGVVTSRLTREDCDRLLSDPSADKWREIKPKTVVKRWILGLLESYPQDVRDIRG